MNPVCDNSDQNSLGRGAGRVTSGSAAPESHANRPLSVEFPSPQRYPDAGFEPSAAWLEQLANGDRGAAAEFITRCGPLIRRRVRGKLRASMRRLFDSEDILSTVGRRLDAYVNARQFEARSSGEFWALVFRIAQNSIVEKARAVKSLEAKEGEDSPLAHAILRRVRQAERADPAASDFVIDQLLDRVENPIDREIVTLWLLDLPQQQIAEVTGLSYDLVRKRWQRTREELRAFIEQGTG